jgi:CBS domain-containing protein
MQISGAPVVDEMGECVGVLSATDFMHQLGNGARAACRTMYAVAESVHSPWQLVEMDDLPTDDVSAHMTADPVTVFSGTPIAELARKMTEAHIHRIIVVDGQHRPIGVVSSTDILAAVGHADRRRP